MKATVRKIQASPFAPILEATKGADPDIMYTVIEYLQESIREAEEAKRKAEDEFLAKKMAEMNISPMIKKLIEQTRLTTEEAKDERTRYILGLDRNGMRESAMRV